MNKNSKNSKNTINSTKVFLSVVLWGLAVLVFMYIGSFIVSLVGNIVYYGALLIISVIMVRYVEKKFRTNK